MVRARGFEGAAAGVLAEGNTSSPSSAAATVAAAAAASGRAEAVCTNIARFRSLGA
jgi:hypothetical protein